MPLDDLVSVIATLQQRIATHRQSLQQNETRTRTALIDPLLTALGWDVSDPALVTPEFDSGDGRADYALLHEGRPAALIEAKHLYEPLERARHQDQVFGYARRSRIKFAGITDGNTWVLEDLSVFEDEPRILDISIENTPASECALKLLMLWRPNLASGRPIAASEPLIGLASVPPTATPVVSPAIETAVPISPEPATDSTVWVSLPDYNPPRGSKAPAAIKFPDDAQAAVGRWRQLPKAVADWLYDKQMLTLETLPIVSGNRRFAVNDKPITHDGKPMTTPEEIGDGEIFIDANVSANSARRHAIAMLQHFHVSPDTVQLQVGQ